MLEKIKEFITRRTKYRLYFTRIIGEERKPSIVVSSPFLKVKEIICFTSEYYEVIEIGNDYAIKSVLLRKIQRDLETHTKIYNYANGVLCLIN